MEHNNKEDLFYTIHCLSETLEGRDLTLGILYNESIPKDIIISRQLLNIVFISASSQRILWFVKIPYTVC